MEDNHSIRGFKGFDKDLSCRGFQYEIGKYYEQEGEAKCCEKGFHFCENPLQVFDYYPPCTSRFCQVEGGGSVDKSEVDSKVATSHIHISSEIGLNGLIDEGVKYILNKVDCYGGKTTNIRNYSASTNTGYCSAATNTGNRSASTNTGNRSAATNTGNYSASTNTGNYSASTNTGNYSASTNTGDRSAATNTGNYSASTNTGNKSAATNTGDCSAATNTGYRSASTNTGNYSAATNTGDCSASTNTGNRSASTNTGYRSASTNTGNYSAATNTGNKSLATVEGKESVAIVTGKDSMACGTLGCWIVLTERGDYDGEINHIKEVKAFKVDGVNIKENTFYRLINGKAVEVELTR